MKGGESAFLAWLYARRDLAPGLVVPLGDDAAVFREDRRFDLVITADAIAEGTHFRRGDPPELIGRKALAVNLSDIAAMGAEPRLAVVTAALPRGFAAALPRAIHRGITRLAKEHGVTLAGGDTIAHAGGLVVSVTLVGRVRRGRAVPRSGASVGDVVAITGAVGGSLTRGRHMTFEPRLREAHDLARLGPPTAMMDVSDGVLIDLARLARASGAGARLFPKDVPLHADVGGPRSRALRDGEDFELLFTMPPRRFARVLARWTSPVPLTAIGAITRRGFVQNDGTMEMPGRDRAVTPRGYEHR